MQLAKEFKDELDRIGKNMEKYITFPVPIKKCDDGKTVAKRLRFIDRFRFMSASLSNRVDNLSGIFISKECKKCMERKKLTQDASLMD